MQILRKIIDYESFEDSQENVYDGVYFSKVAVYKMQLYSTDFTTDSFRRILAFVNVLTVLKRIFSEKSLWCISLLIKLLSCRA